MKSICLVLLLALPSLASAQSEIDLVKIAEWLKVPGLPLEMEDCTARESAVRNINFSKVVYVKVAGNRFIVPMIIYVAPAGAIDKEKYDHQRNLLMHGETAVRQSANNTGYVHMPEHDNALAGLDEIPATQYIKSLSIEGGQWNTPYVGGLSITATNKELGLDYQVFVTGKEESDPELIAKYRIGNGESNIAEYRERIKALTLMVGSSRLVTNQAGVNSVRPPKRVDPGIPNKTKHGSGPRGEKFSDGKGSRLGSTIWKQWLGLGLAALLLVPVFLILRRRSKVRGGGG